MSLMTTLIQLPGDEAPSSWFFFDLDFRVIFTLTRSRRRTKLGLNFQMFMKLKEIISI